MAWFHSRRWLTTFYSSVRSAGGPKNRLPARRLCLEALEDLTLLSTLDVTGGSLDYLASEGVDNNLTISLGGSIQPTSYILSDTGETITLTANAVLAGWTGNGTNTVTGPISSVNFNFTVSLLTGADELNVDGNINVLNNVSLQSGQDITLTGAGISARARPALPRAAAPFPKREQPISPPPIWLCLLARASVVPLRHWRPMSATWKPRRRPAASSSSTALLPRPRSTSAEYPQRRPACR